MRTDLRSQIKSTKEIIERSKRQLEQLQSSGNKNTQLIKIIRNNYVNSVNTLDVLNNLVELNDGKTTTKAVKQDAVKPLPKNTGSSPKHKTSVHMTRAEYRKIHQE